MTDRFWPWLGSIGTSAGAGLVLSTGTNGTPRTGRAATLRGIVPARAPACMTPPA